MQEQHKLKPGCNPDCPACTHRAMNREVSLRQKQDWILHRLGEFSESVEPIGSVSNEKRWNYRNKVCLAVDYQNNEWIIGIHRRDEVVPVQNCPVQHFSVNQNMRLLTDSLPPKKDFPLSWFMQSGKQLTLVVKQRELPDMQWLNIDLITRFQQNGVEGLWLHMHPATGKKVIGKGGWHLVFGHHRSTNEQGLLYGPASFQQVLPELYEHSLTMASRFISPEPGNFVFDLYCGIGASLRHWINAGATAVGVELSGEAIECAAINAPGAALLRGTCAQRIPQMREFAGKALNLKQSVLVYANPPRTGLESEVSFWLAKQLRPAKIAYLSCNAASLYRDLKIFSQNNFKIKSIIPYDFFPQTRHVEMLALIENQAVSDRTTPEKANMFLENTVLNT